MIDHKKTLNDDVEIQSKALFPNREKAKEIWKQVLSNKEFIEKNPYSECEEIWKPIERWLNQLRGSQITKWLDGKTAPKDGTPFWAWLHETGIRKLRWATAKELAEDQGGYPEDYIVGCFVECSYFSSDWTPRYWMPLDAISEPEVT